MSTGVDRYKACFRGTMQCFVSGPFWFPGSPDRHAQIRQLTIRPDDTAIVCYPKSGTHWLYRILSYLNHDGAFDKAQHYPFLPLEVTPPNLPKTAIDLFEAAPSPRVLATHLPFELCPDELQAGRGKIILVIRNPKDVAVSHFYFHKKLKGFGDFENLPWADLIEAYCDSTAFPYGSWFTNVKNWLEHRDDPNVLTVFYEDLKENLANGVSKVAEFIGRPVNEDRAAAIAQLCGFSSMKSSAGPEGRNSDVSERTFLRKGEVGDWKTHFTVAQNEMFNALYEKEMAAYNLGLKFE